MFFPKRTVVKQIEKLLPELLPDEKFVDGNHVLRDIEVQHGLLVERAEAIYSFSHLTIQEFLTAQHIDYNNIEIEPLINKYLCDSRWREVFLLLAGLRKADNLLLVMESKISSLIDTSKLENLLLWVKKSVNTSSKGFKSVGKRASILHHALAYGRRLAFAPLIYKGDRHFTFYSNKHFSYYDEFKEVRDMAQRIAYKYGDSITFYYDLNSAFKSLRANEFQRTYSPTYLPSFTLDVDCHGEAIEELNRYIKWSKEYHAYQNVDFSQLIVSLDSFASQTSKVSKGMEERLKFSNQILNAWLKAFHLNSEIIELSESELQTLCNYLFANVLMIECKEVAVRVSSEVWAGIESRMLLPVENAQ